MLLPDEFGSSSSPSTTACAGDMPLPVVQRREGAVRRLRDDRRASHRGVRTDSIVSGRRRSTMCRAPRTSKGLPCESRTVRALGDDVRQRPARQAGYEAVRAPSQLQGSADLRRGRAARAEIDARRRSRTDTSAPAAAATIGCRIRARRFQRTARLRRRSSPEPCSAPTARGSSRGRAQTGGCCGGRPTLAPSFRSMAFTDPAACAVRAGGACSRPPSIEPARRRAGCADRPGHVDQPLDDDRVRRFAPSSAGRTASRSGRASVFVSSVYRVAIGRFFRGGVDVPPRSGHLESGPRRARRASATTGVRLFDVQLPPSRLASLGASSVARDEYLRLLRRQLP